jgi:hypothetical protein
VDLYGYPSQHDTPPLDAEYYIADVPLSGAAQEPVASQPPATGGVHEQDWLAELVAAGLLHVADTPVDVPSHANQAA